MFGCCDDVIVLQALIRNPRRLDDAAPEVILVPSTRPRENPREEGPLEPNSSDSESGSDDNVYDSSESEVVTSGDEALPSKIRGQPRAPVVAGPFDASRKPTFETNHILDSERNLDYLWREYCLEVPNAGPNGRAAANKFKKDVDALMLVGKECQELDLLDKYQRVQSAIAQVEKVRETPMDLDHLAIT
jgi:hypothetical protein